MMAGTVVAVLAFFGTVNGVPIHDPMLILSLHVPACTLAASAVTLMAWLFGLVTTGTRRSVTPGASPSTEPEIVKLLAEVDELLPLPLLPVLDPVTVPPPMVGESCCAGEVPP